MVRVQIYITYVGIASQMVGSFLHVLCHVHFAVSWRCQCEVPFWRIIHLLYYCGIWYAFATARRAPSATENKTPLDSTITHTLMTLCFLCLIKWPFLMLLGLKGHIAFGLLFKALRRRI